VNTDYGRQLQVKKRRDNHVKLDLSLFNRESFHGPDCPGEPIFLAVLGCLWSLGLLSLLSS